MSVKTFVILASISILIVVIELIRRQKMTFKYSMLWLAIGGLVLFFAVNDKLLKQISVAFGFELLSNFVFFLLLIFFIFVCLLLTAYINEQNNKSDSLAQTLGILEYKVNEFQKKLNSKDQSK